MRASDDVPLPVTTSSGIQGRAKGESGAHHLAHECPANPNGRL